jgi:biotin carboxyl carrier protein
MIRRQSFVLRDGTEREELAVERDGPFHTVLHAGVTRRAEAVRTGGERLSVLFEDGRQVCGRALFRADGAVEISTNRGAVRLALADPLRDRIAHAVEEAGGEAKEEEVRALMPGRILEVCVTPGDSVETGCLLLVIEAMKMQNEIRARASGAVVRVSVSPGEAVESGAPLLALATRPIEALPEIIRLPKG